MLKKLSLAALVAMGSMSVASASTDLSEAIKGVTIGGYLRYRYTETDTEINGKNTHKNVTNNEYKAVLNADIKASDTMTVHSRLVYVDSFYSNKSAIDAGKNGETPKPFNVREAYLKYSANGATVKAGLQALATPLTDHDDDYANGILATYSVSGVTGAAGYYNQVSSAKGQALTNNVAVLAVIANIDVVKAQAWYYNVSDSADNNKDGYDAYFLEAAGSIDPVAVKVQYAAKKENKSDAKTQKFFALAAIGNAKVNDANIQVVAAYLNFGKDGSKVKAGTKNADGLIAAGDITTDQIQQGVTVAEASAGQSTSTASALADGWGGALVAKTTINGIGAGIQYVHASVKPLGIKTKIDEYDLDLNYAYNKKLNFSGYYAVQKVDFDTAVEDVTTTEARFEAKYSF